MPFETVLSHGVMEASGAYNRYATVPASGTVLSLPFLEKALARVELDAGNRAVVIADYGSSQGKNSLIPMRIATKGLRQHLGSTRPILVFHIDQPSNDFNVLFKVLEADGDRYALDDQNVFPAAIGRSFYEHVLPPSSVDLGWSSYAAVWLSRVPTIIPGHFIVFGSSGGVRDKFDRQAAEDWEAFLSLRARELRPGGRLVIVLPGLRDDGSSGFKDVMDQANEVLGEMVADGAITSEERMRMVIPAYPRRKRQLLAPFARDGHFEDLTLEDIVVSELPDGAWTDYEQDGNTQTLATKQALFFRSVFMPSLASALDRVRSGDAESLCAFGDGLEAGLKRRLASQPKAMHSLVQTMILAKRT